MRYVKLNVLVCTFYCEYIKVHHVYHLATMWWCRWSPDSKWLCIPDTRWTSLQWCQIEWFYIVVCELNIREKFHFDWTVVCVFWEVVFIQHRSQFVIPGLFKNTERKTVNRNSLPTSTKKEIGIYITWFLFGLFL